MIVHSNSNSNSLRYKVVNARANTYRDIPDVKNANDICYMVAGEIIDESN